MHAFPLARRLHAELTSPSHMLPLYIDETSLARGAAYYVIPRRRGTTDNLWFHALPLIKHNTFLSQGKWRGDAAIVVCWERLLRQAMLPAKPLTRLAMDLLEFLAPLVLQYDAVLADDISLFCKKWRAAPEDERDACPLFVGQDDPIDENRFNSHLTALLGIKGFLRNLRLTMERSLAPVVYREERTAFAKAVGTDVTATTSLLWPGGLKDPRGCTSIFVTPGVYSEIRDPWVWEIRRLLDGFSGTDGCWRLTNRGKNGDAVLVNWAHVLHLARKQERPTPLLEIDHSGETGIDYLGVRAKEAFAARTKDRYLAPRTKPLHELVRATGLSLNDAVEHPWELYSLGALLDGLQGRCHRFAAARRLAVGRDADGTEARKPLNYSIVHLEYEDRPVMAIRRRGEILFSLPYDPMALWDQRWFHGGLRYRYASMDFWRLRGINRQASGFKHEDVVVEPHPEADAFRRWADLRAGELAGPGFAKALFEQRLSVRIQERLRGDREHLGPFTDLEDSALRQFFERRSSGRLSDQERQELMKLCPGRTLSAVERRRDHLGKQFAHRHGWAAYTRSGFCCQRSHIRRRQWVREGVPVGT